MHGHICCLPTVSRKFCSSVQDKVTNAWLPVLQTAVLVLVACLEAWVACQVVQVECQTWAVLVVPAVLVAPLLRKSTKFCKFNS